MRRVALAIVALLAIWPGAAMCQQAVEDFYRGKKIDMIIGYSSGGTYDLYARLVARYLGGSDVNLGLERGEVDVRGSNSWTSWKATRPDWIAEKKINILVQIGLAKARDLPDVPLLMDLGTNDEDRQLLRVMSSSTHIG